MKTEDRKYLQSDSDYFLSEQWMLSCLTHGRQKAEQHQSQRHWPTKCAALKFGIPDVPLCTSARFTCHLPDQTPIQTEPQLMHRITSLKYYRTEKHGED